MQKRLAIIGTGISGLGCAYFLHSRFDLTIYEQNDFIGGHTNTVTVQEEGREVPIDTGFMVFNHATYPNLVRLFEELAIETQPTDMSFSVQHVPTSLEYNGGSVNLLFGQRRNLLRPRHWRMLLAIRRFGIEAVAALDEPRFEQMNLRDYVRARGYGDDMFDFYLAPMASAVWSTPPEKIENFPATTLLRFWHNHGFLGLDTQHQWWTVCRGAKSYVPRITAGFRDRIHVGRKAARVERQQDCVRVYDAGNGAAEYDKVILACHGDQALSLLADPTEMETRLLAKFKYQRNTTTLHTDPRFMPKTRRCWASWNYRIGANGEPQTHYWMNRLQALGDRINYFVSLNCHEEIAPERVLRRIDYEHPLFDLEAIRAQKELPSLNRLSPRQTTYYAGAWFRNGFHEDGFTSAIDCAGAVVGAPVWKS